MNPTPEQLKQAWAAWEWQRVHRAKVYWSKRWECWVCDDPRRMLLFQAHTPLEAVIQAMEAEQ